MAPWISRGKVVVEVVQDEMAEILGTGRRTYTIRATVKASTRFTISTANFGTPASPIDGELSYGSLDVSALRDNNLRVCGSNGSQRCTAAKIRIYTEGTPGPGLWNAADGYGLPIRSAGHDVGLNAAGAHDVATIAVGPNAAVLQLADFTAAPPLAIPVAVDFSSAGVGSYRSTLVLEYLTQ
jgi:hypothetical protein